VQRQYRGIEYKIEVHNPRHLNQGVSRILVDGKEISGTLLPLFEPGSSHQVEVFLG
jgi:cellobiose phosphorylase